jgi:arginyl-tRNA synthetase
LPPQIVKHMKHIHEIVFDKVKLALAHLYNINPDDKQIQIQKTLKEFEGSITLVVFPLLKISKKSPVDTGNEIGEYLLLNTDELVRFNVIKGFLNLSISVNYRLKYLNYMKESQNIGFVSKLMKPKKIVIEYSSPNTNKPLHLGHIRNNLLGWSVSKILEALGNTVYKVNLVNDRGIHICKSMLAWKELADEKTPHSEEVKGDHFVGKYYVEFDKEYKRQIDDLINQGVSIDDAKIQAEWMVKAREMLKKWEHEDDEIRSLWKRMNDWVYAGFDETYKKLGIRFDKTYYESQTYLKGKGIILDALKNNNLSKKDDGTVFIDLNDKGLDEKVLLRSDGTALYMTQDIGTAVIRFNDFNFDESVYVVGNEQDYHFKVLKIILKELSYPWAENLSHLSYGMVELPRGMGKMKSREGTVVDADDLIENMIRTAEEKSEDLGKLDGLTNDEKDEIFKIIALGALKYFILKVDAKKNMIFNPEESIDFNGNTGPFIQYTYVRIKSLIRKAQQLHSIDVNLINTLDEAEVSLSDKLFDFSEVLAEAGEKRNPAVLANYVFELAKEYNRFYHELPVLKEENPAIRNYRLSLSEITADIIRKSLDLLGIEVPHKM